MQNNHDERYTAVVYTHSREFEPLSFTTDSFQQALSYVDLRGESGDLDYSIIIDNRKGKTVLRYRSRQTWERDQQEVLA